MEPRGAQLKGNGAAELRIEAVSKEFPARGAPQGVRALDQISLDIAAGEFVSLLGPSGCGKSTLLNIIAGFLAPTTGRVLHRDAQIAGPSRTRTVVFQDYALFPWMTVQRNVEFGLKAQGAGPEARATIAGQLIARVGLTGFEERYPHEISGGMKQRAAIARALAPDPDILLMDEPFGALDAQTRVLLQDEVARLSAESHKTVVFVTHSIEEAIFLADRVVVMSARPGRVQSTIEVRLPRPRKPDMRHDPWLVATVRELWHSLKPQWQNNGDHDHA
jgi:NitT/TauT family transport system ATP-binding protein